MDRFSLAFARVCFFVMLFISTACNKADHSQLLDAALPARPAVAQSEGVQTISDAQRLRMLESRVAELETELRAADAAHADIPGGANWD